MKVVLFSTIETASKRSDLVIFMVDLGQQRMIWLQTLAKFLGKIWFFWSNSACQTIDLLLPVPDLSGLPNGKRSTIDCQINPLQNRTGLAFGGLIGRWCDLCRSTWSTKWVKTMVNEQLVPSFDDREELFSRVLRFFGIGESQLVTILADIIEEQTDPTVALMPRQEKWPCVCLQKAKGQKPQRMISAIS